MGNTEGIEESPSTNSKQKNQPRKKGTVDWVPDEEAVECSKCKEKFTVTLRRHHCRSCGNVFFDKCSSQRKYVAESGSKKLQRVCDECFTQPATSPKKKGLDTSSDQDVKETEITRKPENGVSQNDSQFNKSSDVNSSTNSTSDNTSENKKVPIEEPVEDKDLPVDPGKFTWSTERKAQSVDVSDNALLAGRTPTSVGHNPCIMATESLTKERPCFRVQVLSIGKFVGIGLADSFLLLDRGVVLGRQPGCLNCAYFSQGPNIRKLHMMGEQLKKVSLIVPGDLIDVYVDFDDQKVHFWKNEKYQGYLDSVKMKMQEGKLYPTTNLSPNSKVFFCQKGEEMTLDEIEDLNAAQEAALTENPQSNQPPVSTDG